MKVYLVKGTYTKIPDSVCHRLYVSDLCGHYLSFSCRKHIDTSDGFKLVRSERMRVEMRLGKVKEIEIPEETAKKLEELFYKKWISSERENLEKELNKLLSQIEANR